MHLRLHSSVILLGMVVLLFNHCSPFHSDTSKDLLSAQCFAVLETEFEKSYYPFLTNNCTGCHRVGGSGNGAFADPLINIAFENFNLRGSQLIKERALDANHQPPTTGPQHAAELDSIEAKWQAAQTEKASCEERAAAENGSGSGSAGNNGGDPGSAGNAPPVVSEATIFTTQKVMNANQQSPTTLSWSLGNELESNVAAAAGARFSMNVQRGETATGQTYYLFSLPRLQTANRPLKVKFIQIRINGQLISSATTFKGVDETVNANSERTLTITNMVVPYSPSFGDRLSVGFAELVESTGQQVPAVRLVTLNGAGGVFANNCLGCHNSGNARGGLDMTNLNAMLSDGQALPGNAAGSRIIQRMQSNAAPMPPNGVLSSAQVGQAIQWINDGALP